MKNNLSKKNHQSCSGWHCSHCGAFNKLVAAKFCGNCGSPNEAKQEEQPVSKAVNKKKSFKINFRKGYKKLLKYIKYLLLPSNDRFFKRVVASAFLLLVLSVIVGYRMYTNINTIHLAKVKFSDVSVDHPVYAVCKNLLCIDAISFRKNLELAPYEKISATEWNYA